MTDPRMNPLREFELKHNLVTYEACRILGMPYTTYMRTRKLDSIPVDTQYHIEALDLLSPEDFRKLRVARTGE